MARRTKKTGAANARQSPPVDPHLLALPREILTYRRELPRQLEQGQEGRCALINGDQVLSIWDTFDDAYQAGRERFGFDEPFLAQPIDSRDLSRVFPEELSPSKAG